MGKFNELTLINHKSLIPHLKHGGKSGIHIKKSHEGKFTDYCGGTVTSACIAKGKASSNPAIRKRATFAANVRTWKHQDGGTLPHFIPISLEQLNKQKQLALQSQKQKTLNAQLEYQLNLLDKRNKITSAVDKVFDLFSGATTLAVLNKIDSNLKDQLRNNYTGSEISQMINGQMPTIQTNTNGEASVSNATPKWTVDDKGNVHTGNALVDEYIKLQQSLIQQQQSPFKAESLYVDPLQNKGLGIQSILQTPVQVQTPNFLQQIKPTLLSAKKGMKVHTPFGIISSTGDDTGMINRKTGKLK